MRQTEGSLLCLPVRKAELCIAGFDLRLFHRTTELLRVTGTPEVTARARTVPSF